MALGTPVAAFAIEPVAELTDGGRYARLAPPGDAAALGRAMVEAVRSPPGRAGPATGSGASTSARSPTGSALLAARAAGRPPRGAR